MSALDEQLLPLVEEARGRCHSCIHHQAFHLPVSGSVHYCRRLGAEYDDATKERIRDCPHWSPYRDIAPAVRLTREPRNPLFAHIVEAEDQLFWQLKCRLDELGVDLKSLLFLAQPAISSVTDLGWVDGLDGRFGDGPPDDRVAPLGEIVSELRALGYQSVCDILSSVEAKADARPNATGNR